jgi:hypothetical protein
MPNRRAAAAKGKHLILMDTNNNKNKKRIGENGVWTEVLDG